MSIRSPEEVKIDELKQIIADMRLYVLNLERGNRMADKYLSKGNDAEALKQVRLNMIPLLSNAQRKRFGL